MSLLLLTLVSAFTVNAQEKLRRVEQPTSFTYKNLPITIVVHFDDKEMIGREVVAGPDWLHHLSLDVTNASGKDIKSLHINLVLHVGSSQAPKISIPVEMPNSTPKIKIFSPGTRSIFKPTKNDIDFWTNEMKKLGVDDIDRVTLDIRQVIFSDGEIWYRGY